MEYLKLIGIVIIILGFAFKLDTVAVVVAAALATGLVSGMSITHVLTILGKGFMDNRMVSLFFLTLPMIGVVESHGLKQAAVNGISKIKNLSAGKIFNLYLAIREITDAMGIALSGQVQFIRPLINPMAQAAASVKKPLTDKQVDLIKARAAATDNFGNFFSQNLFIASSGVLLMSSTMKSLGYTATPANIVLYSIPMAVITFLITAYYNRRFDKQFEI
ncbi:DUF969 domain-containing protein [Companilactobacillus paralimentarius]|jgi:Predicted membrane protein|nr:DUF969 domain-containing protein [Companilactobacillus paralimentarius]MDR4933004.1 DUF969 domain-containing protein [Companilactobacillus paralimentarius]